MSARRTVRRVLVQPGVDADPARTPSADAMNRGSVVPRTGVTNSKATARPTAPPCQPGTRQIQRGHDADSDDDLAARADRSKAGTAARRCRPRYVAGGIQIARSECAATGAGGTGIQSSSCSLRRATGAPCFDCIPTCRLYPTGSHASASYHACAGQRLPVFDPAARARIDPWRLTDDSRPDAGSDAGADRRFGDRDRSSRAPAA